MRVKRGPQREKWGPALSLRGERHQRGVKDLRQFFLAMEIHWNSIWFSTLRNPHGPTAETKLTKEAFQVPRWLWAHECV